LNRRHYETDLSDREWEIVKPHLPSNKPGGRPRKYPLLEIINAIFYVTRSGCQWRLLPHEFPPWWTVYFYFRLWKIHGIWEALNAELRVTLRSAEGRDEQPSAAIVDSQSVKTTEVGGEHGYDAGKKVNGRKRHLLVDTLGLLLKIVVHPANVQDRDGAKLLFESVEGKLPRLARIWADGAYTGKLVEWTREKLGATLDIVKRNDDVQGFVALPRRWVVERTFGWLGRSRRLSKDYERTMTSSEAFAYAAMVRLMLRRM
jgi:putative transposase